MQTSSMPILLIYGPTASGKSALGVDLARHFDGEIINTDSMQVYQGLPVITAQPNVDEKNGIPHHLYGHMDIDQSGSVARWRDEALATIKDVKKRGKMPILVGGTGLYFEALTRGLADVPPVGDKAVAQAATVLENGGMEALRTEVARIDPAAAARIQGGDQQRLLRALSVYFQTGTALSDFHKNTHPALPAGSWCAMSLKPPRDILYERITHRFTEMLQIGALDEAHFAAQRAVSQTRPAMKALGLNALVCHIKGQIGLEDATQSAVRDTRRYAKRQYTWGAGRFSHWPVIQGETSAQRFEEALRIVENSNGAWGASEEQA